LGTPTGIATRLPTASRANVVTVNLLAALNLTLSALGEWTTSTLAMELFFQTSLLNIARYPNYQNFTLTGPVPNRKCFSF